ncbi:GbsR/MarR family transcriptional regulator [Microaerobacter geothermalis]|uniref:GbsR/MarR family transcriptional regulator n=1 Tax=Microaerobacter geothermalis TaxID=674972 RepID=UPI001F3D097D|nr:GbsR/MarR family transcriptional regulator [Microaerobacter geothermalis]MCF6092912.1 GbsR/MarR family transcriptional regulator [Microaerobacter geothermalis]
MNFQGLSEQETTAILKARNRVIESIAKNMDLYGVTLSVGHLYGTMFFQDEPMTLEDMGSALGMSKTSMSTAVRTLMDLKMVNKVWKKGSRKDNYEVESDWYQNFTDFFSIKWRKSVDMNIQMVKKSIRELEALSQSNKENQALQKIVEMDINKLHSALEFYEWLSRLIDCFESGDIYQLVPKTIEENLHRK